MLYSAHGCPAAQEPGLGRTTLVGTIGLQAVRLARRALDLVYPPACLLCGRAGRDFLCPACAARLPRSDGARCDRCWLPFSGNTCWACAARPLAFVRLRSAWRYEDDARRLVQAFKFRSLSCLAEPLAEALLDCLRTHSLSADAFVPVPLTGMRQRQRGFNQTLLLARQLEASTGTPVLQALKRRRFAGPQARAATAEERSRNVQHAFEVRKGASLAGLRLLLIDDVATTGSTLDACAAALLACGAAEVSALTLARED